MVKRLIGEAIDTLPASYFDGGLKYPCFVPAPCRGTAVVNQTLASPRFGPPGIHPQAFGPSWAGALRMRSWQIPEPPPRYSPRNRPRAAAHAGYCRVNFPDL